MIARHAVAVVTLLSFSPAVAENLDAESARRFIVGKLFAFTCANGSRGAARVDDDGSVIGTIQFHGSERPHPVWLPAETLKLTGETVCIEPSCALLLAKPVIKVFGRPLRDWISPIATLRSACAPPIWYHDRSLQSRCHLTHVSASGAVGEAGYWTSPCPHSDATNSAPAG